MFSGKKILIGVTGGIAAYKSATLIRLLRKAGAEVKVVMTRAAQEFITPLTMRTLANNSVYTEMFEQNVEADIEHISLARWADLILVAPATAHFMAKLDLGLADDLLSTISLATIAPIAIAPAMNKEMWLNSITQKHAQSLKERGIFIVGPSSGEQACGEVGAGRMKEPEDIVKEVAKIFPIENKLFTNKKVVITAGATREAIDPVRFISNQSSGKMGYALAHAFKQNGAEVTLISAPTSLDKPLDVELVSVVSADEMHREVLKNVKGADVFVSVAAVSDFKVKKTSAQKIKKSKTGDDFVLELKQNPDIVADVAKLNKAPFTIAFAAETENLIEHAKEKLTKKKVDAIVANLVGQKENPGFAVDHNSCVVLFKDGREVGFSKMSKVDLAYKLVKCFTDFA